MDYVFSAFIAAVTTTPGPDSLPPAWVGWVSGADGWSRITGPEGAGGFSTAMPHGRPGRRVLCSFWIVGVAHPKAVRLLKIIAASSRRYAIEV